MRPTVLQFSEQDAGEKISAEEFATAEMKPPFRYERVQGRLAVLSTAGPEHRNVSKPFRFALGLYWGQNPDIVDEVDYEGWVHINEQPERIPDICVYLADPENQESVPERIPDLIFEFVSGDRGDQERDYIDKRADYHAIGVREYVIVDRFKESALDLNWSEQDYADRALSAKENYTTPLLPGLEIPLAPAFA